MVAGLAAVKLWLVSAQTLAAIGEARMDDRLFIDLANSILAGEWLGAYDFRTLVKGPFYPLWIAGALVAGVPLLLAERVLYLLACLAVVLALRPMVSSHAMRLGIFTLLCFNPASFADGPMTRVARSGIYPALTLLLVAGAIGMLGRCRKSPGRLLPWSALAGVAGSAFWLTREEGVWIVPFLAVVYGTTAFRMLRAPGPRAQRVAVCVLPVVLGLAGPVAVGWLNHSHYGVFEIVEAESGEMRGAMGALMRVRHPRSVSRVPVPREVREQVYKVSPAFAELRPVVENEALGWAVKLGSSDDIEGGWIRWAIRRAAAKQGHHRSATTAADFYRRLASEVNRACDDSRLDCASRAPLLPSPWRLGYLGSMTSTSVRAAKFVIGFERVSPFPSRSRGQADSLRLFRDITRERLSPRIDDRMRIEGWAFSPLTALNLEVVALSGESVEFRSQWKRSPGIRQRYAEQGRTVATVERARFVVEASCPRRCSLVVQGEEIAPAILPLDGTTRALHRDDLHLEIGTLSLGERNLLSPAVSLDRWRLSCLANVVAVYRAVMLPLGLLALVGFGAISVLVALRRRGSTTWLIQAATLSSILALVLIVAFIDVTSFPAIKVRYLAPIYPLWILFVALAVPQKRTTPDTTAY